LSEENGNGDAKEPTEYQSQQRTVQRTPNFRQHAELRLVDVPGRGSEKMQPVLLYGRSSLPSNPPQEVHHQQNGEPGKGIRQAAK
jgi:hypothetical protein